MAGTLKLGRFFGFDILIHWSWIFIFFLITWTFAEYTLTEIYDGWTAEQRWIAGAIISLVFFFSILMHEVSHSIVARRYGIPVASITLFVFGGVSSLGKEPDNARQEFWVAIVGPLTSFAASAIFAAGYLILDPIEEGTAAVSAHLAVINLLIGGFNLVPGFPLDGGRVLRSVLWARRKNRLEATRMASRTGEVVAYGIMGLGIFAFFFVSVITGIWFFLIGNFLRQAAAASYGQLLIETLIKGVPVSKLTRTDYVTVSPDMRLSELAEDYILAGKGRAFPVVAGEELLGLITLTDLKAVAREEWAATTVYRAMTPNEKLKTAGSQDDLSVVFAMMATENLNQVPVVEGRWLRGLVLRSDMLHYLQVRQEIGAGDERSLALDPRQ